MTDADHTAVADAREQLVGELEVLRHLPFVARDAVAIDLAVGVVVGADLGQHAGGDQGAHHARAEVRLVHVEVVGHIVVRRDHAGFPSRQLAGYQNADESDGSFSTNIQTAIFEQRGQNAALEARTAGDGAAAPGRDLLVLDIGELDAGVALGCDFFSMLREKAESLFGQFELRRELKRFEFSCRRCGQLGCLSESELLTRARGCVTDQLFGSRRHAFRTLNGALHGAVGFSGVDLLHSRFEDLGGWGKKKSSAEAVQ